jgi:hypothetical protein
MSDFKTRFPDGKLVTALGDQITYKRGDAEYTIWAVIDSVGQNDSIEERKNIISILRSDLPFEPQRTDTVITRFGTYTIDAQVQTDDNYYRYVVR